MSEHRALTVGLLADHPKAGGASFVDVVRLAFADVRASGRLDRELRVIEEHADGLPTGSAAAVESAFARLRDSEAIAVIGPAISDNALIVRDLADAAGLPCVNWTGGELTRSAWMFHYQVGSLEEEPGFLALGDDLVAPTGDLALTGCVLEVNGCVVESAAIVCHQARSHFHYESLRSGYDGTHLTHFSSDLPR